MTLQVDTDTLMPPFGVAERLCDETWVTQPSDLFRFWLQTHVDAIGPRFWRAAVLRECLPDPVSDLRFEADGPLTQKQVRTALVRVTVGATP